MLHLRPIVLAALVTLIGTAGLSQPSQAAATSKLDPALQLLLQDSVSRPGSNLIVQSSTGSEWIEVFVQGDLDERLIREAGGQPSSMLNQVATVRIPRSRLMDLAASDRVTRIQGAVELQPMLDENANETEVIESWGGPPPSFNNTGFTGSGVIVGIVDTGIDIQHDDFRDANGNTRILTLWDHFNSSSPHPAGFSYGREWSASEINSGACNETDEFGHGTHVAGTVVGNGRATGNGHAPYRYVGMAPEADLVVVKLSAVTDTRILDSIQYVFDRADALGKDAVVCVPYGKQSGPHDGSDPLDVGIDALSGPGRVVVVPVGNDGETGVHARLDAHTRAVSPSISYVVSSEIQAGVEIVKMEGWYDPGLKLAFTLTSPNGHVLGPVYEGEVKGGSWADGRASILANGPPAASGAKQIFIQNSSLGATYIAAGEWRLDVEVLSGNGHADFWIYDKTVATEFADGRDDMGTLSTPGTASSAVSVSAYAVNTRWRSITGANMLWVSADPGGIAEFSSRGPRRDRIRKPDIAASGYGVVSSLSSSANTVWSGHIVDDGVHFMAKGTSCAAAVVAGGIAILLEEHQGLDPESIKNILVVRSRVDSQTGPLYRNSSSFGGDNGFIWGGGKLNMSQPAQTAVEDPGVGGRLPVLMGAPYPNPVNASLARVPVQLTEDAEMRVVVYDVLGREVQVLHDGPLTTGSHVLQWDGTDRMSRPVSSGRYYVVATNQGTRESRAVILVR